MKDIAKKLIRLVESEPERNEFSLSGIKKDLGITQKQTETLVSIAEPFFKKYTGRSLRFRDRKSNSKPKTVKKSKKQNDAPVVTEKFIGG